MTAPGLLVENSAIPALFLFLMAVVANLPWLNERYWALIATKGSRKPPVYRWLEWLVGAAGVWVLGAALESCDDAFTVQGPVFVVVYGLLYAVLSFPGFIYHHFLRTGQQPHPSEESRRPDESL